MVNLIAKSSDALSVDLLEAGESTETSDEIETNDPSMLWSSATLRSIVACFAWWCV